MITLTDINQAVESTVKQVVKTLFSYDVPIASADLQEPIIRPSIKVIFEGAASGLFNHHYKERTLTCRIYFFAKDRQKPKVENLKVQEALEGAFLDGLTIGPEFIVPVDELESIVSDTVLICGFDIDVIELLPDTDTSEPMEELELSGLTLEEELQMAVTMPSIEVIFKQLAGSLIARSARGVAVLIIKDDTDPDFVYKKYKDASEVDEDKALFKAENLQAIKDVLTFQVTAQCQQAKLPQNANL